jgi:hypothetical protein
VDFRTPLLVEECVAAAVIEDVMVSGRNRNLIAMAVAATTITGP